MAARPHHLRETRASAAWIYSTGDISSGDERSRRMTLKMIERRPLVRPVQTPIDSFLRNGYNIN
eukprot:1840251-Amphidinium_carterae.1